MATVVNIPERGPPLRKGDIRFNTELYGNGDQEGRPHDAEEEDEDEANGKGRRKIEIKYIHDKSKRHITFSKRKAGIMKKAYELSTLTGTQLMLLVVSETGLVYTFTTNKLQPFVLDGPGQALIANYLGSDGNAANSQDDAESEAADDSRPDEEMSPPLTHPAPPRIDISSSHENGLPSGHSSSHYGASPHASSQSLPFSDHQASQQYGMGPGSDNGSYGYDHNANPLGLPPIYPPMNDAMGMPGYPLSAPASAQQLLAASYVDVGDRAVKRRRTDGDLRTRSRSTDGQQLPPTPTSAVPPSLPTHNGRRTPPPENVPFPTDSLDQRRQFFESQFGDVELLFKEHPSLINATYVYQAKDNALDIPLSLPSDVLDTDPPVVRYMSMLRDNILHFSDVHEAWADEVPMSQDTVTAYLEFFFEHILPQFQLGARVGLDLCLAMEEFLEFLCNSLDWPPFNVSRLGSSHSAFTSLVASEDAYSKTRVNPDGSTRQRGAPKIKPRKALNPAIRGPRIQRLLQEYARWNMKNRGHELGNRRGTRVAATFKLLKVRRTFCVCEASEFECWTPGREKVGYFKIRFPPSALKIIRRLDGIRLHVRCIDDGSEWAIVAYDGAELGNDNEEDEDDNWNESSEFRRAINQLGLDEEGAKLWVLKRRGMRELIDAGELPDDGFESIVPPKGGKPSFRVKQIGAPGPNPTKSASPQDDEDES